MGPYCLNGAFHTGARGKVYEKNFFDCFYNHQTICVLKFKNIDKF